MTRMLALLYRVKQGPHGAAVIAMIAGSAALVVLLLVGHIFQFWPVAIAVTVGVIGGMLATVMAALSRLRGKLNDVHYALSLESGLQRAGYQFADLFTDGGAASPSLQLHSLKILLFCAPKRILELGSGQSTKLLSAYARHHPEAYVLTLEQDARWVNRLAGQITHDYRHVPLEGKDFVCRGSGLHLTTTWYQDLPELHAAKFDYVLVDGPDPGTLGTEHTNYSRCGILQYVPEILADSFVVVFDDAERYGEIMTTTAFETVLRACGVRHVRFTIHGIKDQIVFCSPDRAFLRSI